MMLFWACAFFELFNLKVGPRIHKRIFNLLIPLLAYLLIASISVVLKESGFENIKKSMIQIYSPIIIFISIISIKTFKNNYNIRRMLKALYVTGIILSIYVAIINIDPMSIVKTPSIETKKGTMYYDTGAGYGIGKLEIFRRYTIPGMSPNEYGPMMVPILLIGVYLLKITKNSMKVVYFFLSIFLCYCLAMTGSRGTFIILLAGIIYLICSKWFSKNEIVIICCIAVASILSVAKLVFYRLIITLAIFLPIDLTFIDKNAQNLTKDPHLMHYQETISYVVKNPIWGIGMDKFKDLISYEKMSNNYLIISTAYGIFASISYILFLILFFIALQKRIKKLPRNTSIRSLGVLLGAGSIVFIIYLNASFTDFFFIWIWFGLAAAWLRNTYYCEDFATE